MLPATWHKRAGQASVWVYVQMSRRENAVFSTWLRLGGKQRDKRQQA